MEGKLGVREILNTGKDKRTGVAYGAGAGTRTGARTEERVEQRNVLNRGACCRGCDTHSNPSVFRLSIVLYVAIIQYSTM